MLIDHIGATVMLSYVRALTDMAAAQKALLVYNIMRIIGRIAFPIFCFLLVEGAHHTRDPKKYAMRLAIGALLSEIPFRGAFGTGGCSVMVTLLLGYLMILCMARGKGFWKVVVIVPFYILAELLHTDYAGDGILLIAVLALTRGVKYEKLWRVAWFASMFLSPTRWNIGYNIMFPVTQCEGLAIVPILCYNGQKRTHSKAVQWAFYLFYPVHIALLWGLNTLLFG